MVYAPPAIPVTTPVEETLPVAVLDDDHVPPAVVQESVVVCPLQTVPLPDMDATDGVVFTVTVDETAVVAPHALVAVTV
jgi:hypothetical protein